MQNYVLNLTNLTNFYAIETRWNVMWTHEPPSRVLLKYSPSGHTGKGGALPESSVSTCVTYELMTDTHLDVIGPSVSRGGCRPPSWPAWAPTWSPRSGSTTGSPTAAKRRPSDTNWLWTRPLAASRPPRLTPPSQPVPNPVRARGSTGKWWRAPSPVLLQSTGTIRKLWKCSNVNFVARFVQVWSTVSRSCVTAWAQPEGAAGREWGVSWSVRSNWSPVRHSWSQETLNRSDRHSVPKYRVSRRKNPSKVKINIKIALWWLAVVPLISSSLWFYHRGHGTNRNILVNVD